MRKRFLHTSFLLAFAFLFMQVQAGSGGPDAYGYTWVDSDDASLSFSWIDITGMAGAVQVSGLADDNAVGMFNIGFDYPYYWQDYDQVKIGSNGWVSFDNVGNIASCFPTIPSPGGAGDNLLSPFMSDLNFAGATNPGEMWYWTNNQDSFIIQWVNVPWWVQAVPDFAGSNTFQLVLDKNDTTITFNYLDTDAAAFLPGSNCPTYMEVGIENLTGNVGLATHSGTTLPGDNFSIKFSYPDTVTFQVPDATPAWNANSENAGQFYFTNNAIDMEANVANVGNTDITNVISVDGELQDLSFTQVWSDQSSIPSLVAGSDQSVTFANQATVTSPGQYYYNVSTANSQDINPSNNDNTVEISAITAGAGGRYNLTYSTLNAPDGSISWAGGGNDDGVAVKYVPPAYPYTIDSVTLFILGDDQDPNTPVLVGFTLELYDSIDGSPLVSDSITPAMVIEDDWNTWALSSPITVNSGAVYLAWVQGGTGIAIGTEAFGPISQRSYEVLSGAWAPYRQNTVEDMLFVLHGSTIVGIEESPTFESLVAYPNPVRDLLNVEYNLQGLSDLNFSLLNTMGQVVWSKNHSQIPAGSYEFNIETSQLSSGVYFLNMIENGKRMVKKIIVE